MMRIFVVFFFLVFQLLASKSFILSLDNLHAKKNNTSSLAHFPLVMELSANLMQVIPFYFKLKFSVEKSMELR